MKARWVSLLLLRLCIISLFAPFVLGAEAGGNNGIFFVEQASTWEKIGCSLGFGRCAYSNEGLVVFKEQERQRLAEQSVISAGIRLEGQETVVPGFTSREVAQGTLVGFCARTLLEAGSTDTCRNSYKGVTTVFTIDGNGKSVTVNKVFANGAYADVCYVQTLREAKRYVYSKALSYGNCATTGASTQGSLDFSYSITAVAQGRTCTPQWQCAGTSQIQYLRADCTTDSTRTCVTATTGTFKCEAREGDDECVRVAEPTGNPDEGDVAPVDGDEKCEVGIGEQCTSADCAEEPTCKDLVVDDPSDGVVCKETSECQQGWTCNVALGKCIEPANCPTVASPVCGVDAKTYSNACVAETKGVEVASKGVCKTDGGTFSSDEEQLFIVSGVLLFVIALVGIVYWTKFRKRR